MRAASHSCDDGYIALNTFAILDAITVKNGCTFLHVKQIEKGGGHTIYDKKGHRSH